MDTAQPTEPKPGALSGNVASHCNMLLLVRVCGLHRDQVYLLLVGSRRCYPIKLGRLPT
jgi:hypothetical protein